MTSRPTAAAPILTVLVLVLVMLGAYVGGYLLLVKRVVRRVTFNAPIVGRTYLFGGDTAARVFAPINHIDKTLIRR